MKQKNVLLEINRMKEIMGLSLLNEAGIPGLASDMIRAAFGETTQTATQKLRTIVGDIGTSISDDLADEMVTAFPRLLDDLNVWDTLSDATRKGFMRVFAEIPEVADSIYKNILNQANVTADEFAKAVANKMDEAAEAGRQIDYNTAVKELLEEAGVEGADEVSVVLAKSGRKAYDDVVEAGSNIVSPLSRRIKTVAEAEAYFEELIGLPLKKLKTIPGMQAIITQTCQKMLGKTLDEINKMTRKALDEITSNPEYVKILNRANETNWETFVRNFNAVKDTLFIGYKKTGGKWYNPFSGEDLINSSDMRELSFLRTLSKTSTTYLTGSFLVNLVLGIFKGYDAGTVVINAYDNSIGSLIGYFTNMFSEYRDEQGDLTREEVIKAFTPIASQLGKSMDDYDFEEIQRGVFRAIDFSDNPQDYAIIKREGEIDMKPWTQEMENTNWTDVLVNPEKWNLFN